MHMQRKPLHTPFECSKLVRRNPNASSGKNVKQWKFYSLLVGDNLYDRYGNWPGGFL